MLGRTERGAIIASYAISVAHGLPEKQECIH